MIEKNINFRGQAIRFDDQYRCFGKGKLSQTAFLLNVEMGKIAVLVICGFILSLLHEAFHLLGKIPPPIFRHLTLIYVGLSPDRF